MNLNFIWLTRSKKLIKILKYLYIIGFIWITGCSLFSAPKPEMEDHKEAIRKTFPDNYDNVFKAARIALSKYRLAVDDYESGILQTSYILRENIWLPPHRQQKNKNRLRNQIKIIVLKGRSSQHKNATQVLIHKNISQKKNFFEPLKSISSDGLEELSLLYRIERELDIEKKLNRIQK